MCVFWIDMTSCFAIYFSMTLKYTSCLCCLILWPFLDISSLPGDKLSCWNSCWSCSHLSQRGSGLHVAISLFMELQRVKSVGHLHKMSKGMLLFDFNLLNLWNKDAFSVQASSISAVLTALCAASPVAISFLYAPSSSLSLVNLTAAKFSCLLLKPFHYMLHNFSLWGPRHDLQTSLGRNWIRRPKLQHREKIEFGEWSVSLTLQCEMFQHSWIIGCWRVNVMIVLKSSCLTFGELGLKV